MPTVLIIEDDDLNRHMYQQTFTFKGYTVEVAADGVEGLEKAQATRPTIILLDIVMPKLNGIDMLRKLKALSEARDVPVVILTNLVGTRDIDDALEAGAIKYIGKSDYSPREIADMVDELVSSLGKETGKPAGHKN